MESMFEIITGEDNQQYKKAYNKLFPVYISDALIELECSRINHPPSAGGLGTLRHLINAKDLLFPELIPTFNEWTLNRYKAFCSEEDVVSLAGAASTGKSQDTAVFGLLWWLQSPSTRTLVVCSTTLNALKKRIWSYITEFYYKVPGLPPHVSNANPPKIVWSHKDTKHGIFGMALRDGDSDKAIADIIGIHPKEGMLLIVDECTDVTLGVIDALPNISQGGLDYFKFIAIGNSKYKHDTHGILCEPIAGWSSIDPDIDRQWKTRYGTCLYFDAYDSPGVHFPELAGPGKPFKFLWDSKKIAKEEQNLGKDHPKFWRFVRGFWCPEDDDKTVCTPALIETHKAYDKPHWAGRHLFEVVACDPAFTAGGDECILRRSRVGINVQGKLTISTEEIVSIPLEGTSNTPITYQISDYVVDYCNQYNIEPQHFVIDSTMAGSSVADVIAFAWSNDICRVASSGKPSNRPVEGFLDETSKDVYDRKASELCFIARDYLVSNCLRKLDKESASELCNRMFTFKGRKLYVEPKKEYKIRTGREHAAKGSPDRSDALSLTCWLVYELGYPPSYVDLEYLSNASNIYTTKFGKLRPRDEDSNDIGISIEADFSVDSY